MLPVEVQRWRLARKSTRREMYRNRDISRCIAFVVYSFFQLADSAVIVRRAPPPQSSPSLISPVGGSAQTAKAASATPSTTWSQTNEITIIAVVIGGVFLLGFGLVIWIILRRNRKALERQTQTLEPSGPEFCKDVSSAFDTKVVPVVYDNNLESGVNRSSWASYVISIPPRDDTLSPSNTISTRQLYISNQVRRAREKAAELEERSVIARSPSTASRPDRPSSWTGSEVTAAPSPSDELPPVPSGSKSSSNPADEKLEHAIRQIEVLNDRICELELQRESLGVLGQSNHTLGFRNNDNNMPI
ncbi:hypothetical protein B0H16DRAFT_269275 [Mycena metata]|uniref:Uncharacterized protein n=1 Tax=Mycena metata TaxID=1033252 RepID=A0AAD7MQH0_9AGAR|nr:hypothetical protein B0H16DRAFT_269275 [Mycena metata]